MPKANPALEVLVDAIGPDFYEARWRSLSPLSRWWWTLRGFNPGGRKGAPALR